MVLLFENGFSGWGQFLQSFYRSTREYVTCAPAKALQKLSPSRKTTVHQTRNFKLENAKNQGQIDSGLVPIPFLYIIGCKNPIHDRSFALIASIYQSSTNTSDASFAVDGNLETCFFTKEDQMDNDRQIQCRFLYIVCFATCSQSMYY